MLEKLVAADLIIYASPLYVYSMTGLMKDFLDRCLPLAMPFFEATSAANKSTAHPKRYPRTAPQKMLLMSSCAFPEVNHFASLVQTFKHMAVQSNIEYLGEILKPAAMLLLRFDLIDAFRPALIDARQNIKQNV